jgi:arylsulfatase A-like enzyme
MNNTFSDNLIEERAVELIHTLRQPWFMYVPFQAVHAPLEVPDSYLARYPNLQGKEQIKAGMLTALDDALGDIFTALAANKSVETNTITIFFSDNGAPFHFGGSNLPLKGQKHTLYEGGMKVPTLIRSPLLPAASKGTENGKFYSVVDWLPTLVKLGGGNTAKNKPLDGYDMWPSIVDTGTRRHYTVLMHLYSHTLPSTQVHLHRGKNCSTVLSTRAGQRRRCRGRGLRCAWAI